VSADAYPAKRIHLRRGDTVPLTRFQWNILFSVWVLGMVGFPVASYLGAPLPAIAYIGYSSLCTFILANHPWVVRVVKQLDKENDENTKDAPDVEDRDKR
jgi:hypothetical protein